MSFSVFYDNNKVKLKKILKGLYVDKKPLDSKNAKIIEFLKTKL